MKYQRVNDVPQESVEALYERLSGEAEEGGYFLNPDRDFAQELIRSLLFNQERYGYWACPCRRASGKPDQDRDIVCPCDYRDQDLEEFGACYCALYVDEGISQGQRESGSIPERRPPEKERNPLEEGKKEPDPSPLPYPVWRCKVCGYLCARSEPPSLCPICKARKDRFERFM